MKPPSGSPPDMSAIKPFTVYYSVSPIPLAQYIQIQQTNEDDNQSCCGCLLAYKS